MYKLTLILFAFFSLVLPILAVPVPASDQVDGKSAALTGSGRGTWFTPGLGSCGETNSAADSIVALSTNFGKKYCGQTITIHYKGKTASAVVTDSCPSCGNGDVDMSPATFKQLANQAVGVVPISWSVY
ncbi:expansin family protein [Russula emetica]|nr:expansin family protein [Russula emetica]KAF8490778.1 expansin family protein [Russula emetica]